MVGLVLVSHSRALATAVRELVLSMSGPKFPSPSPQEPAERAELGTDATEILEGINAVMSEEGVLVLLDIGSAILSAETALEFLEEPQRAKGAPVRSASCRRCCRCRRAGCSWSQLRRSKQRSSESPSAQNGTPRRLDRSSRRLGGEDNLRRQPDSQSDCGRSKSSWAARSPCGRTDPPGSQI